MCAISKSSKVKVLFCHVGAWQPQCSLFIILKRVAIYVHIHRLCSKHKRNNMGTRERTNSYSKWWIFLLDTYWLLGWTWRKCPQPAIIEGPKTPRFLTWLDRAFLEGLLAEAAGIEKKYMFFSCISCNIQVIAPLKWQKIKNHGKIVNYHFHMVTAVERREAESERL